METVVRCCCGLDVHKDTVQACVRSLDERGKLTTEVRSFSTMTQGILSLGDWLAEKQITVVAMESTGVYWKPIWNLLEDRWKLLLVNAQHIKHVPGRKTDVLDCQWIAQLLQHGLLKGSFVPPRANRELRDLTRQRSQLVADRVRVGNRIAKVLEDANIKLGSVASDLLGKSSRRMLEAMVAGTEDPTALADLALGRLTSKHEALVSALRGRLNEHHRFMLRMLLQQVSSLDTLVAEFEMRIVAQTRNWQESLERIDRIQGVDLVAARAILAEIGTDMSVFPSADHLAAWAGMCPGNHESAGKRKRGTTRKGNRWLRATLVQCAWAASHCKDCYLASQYRRLASRRGKKRALIAVGRSILIIIYEMLAHGTTYEDLGGDWFDRRSPQRLQQHLVRRLEKLGFKVALTPAQSAAA